jgi:hypothetical protein
VWLGKTTLLNQSKSVSNESYLKKIIKPLEMVGFHVYKKKLSWAPVAHTYNPSYSGGRDQEDRSLKPAQAYSSVRAYLKKSLSYKWAGGVAEGEGPEFNPKYHKKKKKRSSVVMHNCNLSTGG